MSGKKTTNVTVPQKLTESERKAVKELVAKHKGADGAEMERIILQSRNQLRSKEITSVKDLKNLLIEIKYFENIANTYDAGDPIVAKHMKEMINGRRFQDAIAQDFFHKFDTDHSGTITLKEILTGFTVVWHGEPKERFTIQFEAWDTDGSGTLTKEEVVAGWYEMFSAMLITMPIKIGAAYLNHFVQIYCTGGERSDEENDRLASELLIHITHCVNEGVEWTLQKFRLNKTAEKIADTLFQLMDTNNDKVLTKEEYVNGMSDPTISSQISEMTTALVEPFTDYSADCAEEYEKWVQNHFSELFTEDDDD